MYRFAPSVGVQARPARGEILSALGHGDNNNPTFKGNESPKATVKDSKEYMTTVVPACGIMYCIYSVGRGVSLHTGTTGRTLSHP